MKKAKSSGFMPILYGIGTMLITTLVLSIPGAALVTGGMVNQRALSVLAVIITALGGFFGGWTASKKAQKSPLPMAVISAALYLLLVFIVRGLLFGGVAEKPLWIILAAMIAAVAGGIVGTGKKQRVKHRVR